MSAGPMSAEECCGGVMSQVVQERVLPPGMVGQEAAHVENRASDHDQTVPLDLSRKHVVHRHRWTIQFQSALVDCISDALGQPGGSHLRKNGGALPGGDFSSSTSFSVVFST